MKVGGLRHGGLGGDAARATARAERHERRRAAPEQRDLVSRDWMRPEQIEVQNYVHVGGDGWG